MTTTVGKPREPSSGYKNKNKRKCVRRHVLAFKLERTDTTLDLSQKAFEQLADVDLVIWVGRNLQRELRKEDWAAGKDVIYSVLLALA